MKAPSVDIKNLLVSEGLGVFGATSGWGVFIGKEPQDPDHCITILDTTGGASQIPVNQPIDGDGDEHRVGLVESCGIQVIVRAMTYEDSYSRADKVAKALSNRKEFTSADGTAKYLGVWRQSNPISLGEDDKARHVFSINFIAPRTPVGAG